MTCSSICVVSNDFTSLCFWSVHCCLFCSSGSTWGRTSPRTNSLCNTRRRLQRLLSLRCLHLLLPPPLPSSSGVIWIFLPTRIKSLPPPPSLHCCNKCISRCYAFPPLQLPLRQWSQRWHG